MSSVWDKRSPWVAGMQRKEGEALLDGKRTVCRPTFLSICPIRDNQRHVLNLVRPVVFCLFLAFFQSQGEPKGSGMEIMHEKHFPYFSTKKCMEQGQKIVEGGEIHSKHGILKG